METKPKTPEAKTGPWLISIKEAADLLGVSSRQMYNIANIEGFPRLRIGHRYLIDPVRLRQWVDDHMGGGVDIAV